MPCVHRWIYRSSHAGTCTYKLCSRCGLVVWFATKGCRSCPTR